jgi:excisionase family DNA binding protein
MSNGNKDLPKSSSALRRNRKSSGRKTPVAVEPSPGTLALTVNETAYLLRVRPNTVWNLIADRQIASVSINRRRLIAKSAVEDFIATGGTASLKHSSARDDSDGRSL